jgi:flavin-dependent dehydrogenase
MLRRNGTRDIDVAVLGGGPAGTATALTLSRKGYSVVVAEPSDYRKARIGEMLPPAARPLLVSLGVWDRFLAENHSPSFAIRSAWGQPLLYHNDFIFNPHGSGWHVDRSRLDAMLARAAEDAGACVCRGARLISFEENGKNWRLEIASNDSCMFRTKLAVDATGRRAWLAHRQGAKRINHDHLVGVVTSLSPGPHYRDPGRYTLLESVEDGWWYSAFLPNSDVVTAYMTDGNLYARGSRVGANYWRRKLQNTTHTSRRVSRLVLVSGPVIVAANSSQLDRFAGDNWLAVGDAAMAFDPLSGQGIFKALDSGVKAADAIDAYFSGRKSSFEGYAGAVKKGFEKYLAIRRIYYRREMRWPESPFWQRRHSPTHKEKLERSPAKWGLYG